MKVRQLITLESNKNKEKRNKKKNNIKKIKKILSQKTYPPCVSLKLLLPDQPIQIILPHNTDNIPDNIDKIPAIILERPLTI
jgi:hypothetical protein